MGDRGVPMVRVQSEERRYAVEDVLGRDVSSVFPSTAKQQGLGGGLGGLDKSETVAALGGRSFVTESELVELKAKRGETVEDGTAAPASKPLWKVLEEQQQAKDEQYQENGRIIKQGGNKPLEEDEVTFLDEVESSRRAAEARTAAVESDELEAFRLLRETTVVKGPAEPAGAAAAGPAAAPVAAAAPPQAAALPAQAPKRKPAAAVVRVAKKSRADAAAPPPAPAQPAAAPAAEPPAVPAAAAEDQGGLLGLGAYGSDSD